MIRSVQSSVVYDISAQWHAHTCEQFLYTLSQKNDTDDAHYNFSARQAILLIFVVDVAEWECYRMTSFAIKHNNNENNNVCGFVPCIETILTDSFLVNLA